MRMLKLLLLAFVVARLGAGGPPAWLTDTVTDLTPATATATVTTSTVPAVTAAADPGTVADLAVAVTMRTDDGAPKDQSRWEQDTVTYTVTGADPATVDIIGQVFAYAADVTGLTFVPVGGDADMTITVGDGVAPRARVWMADNRIVAADVAFYPGRERVVWEEILQALGPMGDHGPVGSVFSTDQTAARPGDFDTFVLTRLYQADRLHDAGDETAARTLFHP